jgi:hypothetical protein
MTVVHGPTEGVLVAVLVLVVADMNTVSDTVAVPVAAIAAILTALAWWYSPLPNNNGGALSADAGRYWGFSNSEEEK